MKKVLLCMIVLTTPLAHAVGDPTMCAQLSNIYGYSARLRDAGKTPQDALNAAQGMNAVPKAERKRAINLVFFNRDFARLRPDELQNEAFRQCYYQPKPMQPLK